MATDLLQLSTITVAVRDLQKDDETILRKKLKDPNRFLRLLTLDTIARRHSHLETDLIELLKAPDLVTQQAAHRALVFVARGTDFGPLPGSSRRGIERAIEKWLQWLALQQSASSEKPVIAAGKVAKPATLEMVPLALVHNEEPALSSGVMKARDELVNAKGSEQISVLARLRDTKDRNSAETIALAIPKLTGDIQQQAREALIQRLSLVSSAVLRDKLQDDNPEVRSAAALAIGRKIAKENIADLLQLLDDPEMAVVQSARVALTELSGEDFGPNSDTDRRGRAEAVAAWHKWWKERQSRKP